MARQIQVLVFTADVRVQVPPRPPKRTSFGMSFFLLSEIFYAILIKNREGVACVKKIISLMLLLLLSGCAMNGGEERVETTLQTIPVQTVSVIPEPEATAAGEPELLMPLVDPADTDFVRVTDYLPGVLTQLKYATSDNFTGQPVYEFQDIFLRYGTVKKLMAVARELEEQGIGLKIWDGFRPVSAQFRLWEICPDSTYVANPNKGYSNHSRGFAVDLTLVDGQGNELEMPTAFDDFSARADRDYSDCTQTQRANAQLLEAVMEKHGFQGYWGEWWHFNDTTKYDVEKYFDPGVIHSQVTSVQTPLLRQLQVPDSEVLTIPAGERVTVLGYEEDYIMAEYWGYRGYAAQADFQ